MAVTFRVNRKFLFKPWLLLTIFPFFHWSSSVVLLRDPFYFQEEISVLILVSRSQTGAFMFVIHTKNDFAVTFGTLIIGNCSFFIISWVEIMAVRKIEINLPLLRSFDLILKQCWILSKMIFSNCRFQIEQKKNERENWRCSWLKFNSKTKQKLI